MTEQRLSSFLGFAHCEVLFFSFIFGLVFYERKKGKLLCALEVLVACSVRQSWNKCNVLPASCLFINKKKKKKKGFHSLFPFPVHPLGNNETDL